LPVAKNTMNAPIIRVIIPTDAIKRAPVPVKASTGAAAGPGAGPSGGGKTLMVTSVVLFSGEMSITVGSSGRIDTPVVNTSGSTAVAAISTTGLLTRRSQQVRSG